MALMLIEWVPGRDGGRGAWWVKLNGTCLFPLDLSEKAVPAELRALTGQRLSDLADGAEVLK